MKGLSVIIGVFILVFCTVTSRAANLERISAQTGIPVATLQAERTSTGLGWGELENAHLLANALAANGSNLTFNDLVAMHQARQGCEQCAPLKPGNNACAEPQHGSWQERHGPWQERHDGSRQKRHEHWQRSHFQDDYHTRCRPWLEP